MRKKILILIVMMSVVAMPVWAMGQVSSLNLLVAKSPGGTVDAIVDFSNSGEAVVATFDILYDADALELAGGARAGEALSGTDFAMTSKSLSPGRLRIILMPPMKDPLPLIPSGPIVRLSLNPKDGITGDWDLGNITLGDRRAKEVSYQKQILVGK